MLLLGGITSLPEIAVGGTAGVTWNADLAVSNIIGGVALQVVVIAIGDALLRGHAMTFQVAKPYPSAGRVLLLLLCVVIAGALVGDVLIFGMGLWSAIILATGIGLFWIISRYKDSEAWQPNPEPLAQAREKTKPVGLRKAVLLTSRMGAAIFVAGYLLSMTGDAIARGTGISQNFLGATLVGLAASLPEISTVVAAVRLKRYIMAFSDIFDLMLIFLIDAAYPGPAASTSRAVSPPSVPCWASR